MGNGLGECSSGLRRGKRSASARAAADGTGSPVASPAKHEIDSISCTHEDQCSADGYYVDASENFQAFVASKS